VTNVTTVVDLGILPLKTADAGSGRPSSRIYDTILGGAEPIDRRPSTLDLKIMYVCPKCKGELRHLHCDLCQITYPVTDGIPCFMTGNLEPSNEAIREIYDDIYLHHEDVWIDQGRADDFQQYFSALIGGLKHERLLEIGCGEGNLLAVLPGTQKFGIDPSIHALQRARKRSSANCAIARCEQLPFAAGTFDVVVAVGVMEHFEKIDDAISEVRRILAPRGHYVALIQADQTRAERAMLKARQYLYPNFRPFGLLRWLGKWLNKKLRHPIVQPLRKSYTGDSAKNCLQRNGLQVSQIITQKTDPSAPLGGPHIVVLVSSAPH
jgi:SAM-dependent methyltransferase